MIRNFVQTDFEKIINQSIIPILIGVYQCLPFDVRDRARAPSRTRKQYEKREKQSTYSQKITRHKMAVEEFSIIAVCQFA